MKRIIVTHINPDLDAVTSCWLIRKYWPGWSQATIKLVPAGSRYQAKEDEVVVHVDTGLGKYDHHQAGLTDELTCAAYLVWQASQKYLVKRDKVEQAGLKRLINLVVEIDNFRELNWPEADSDRYDLGLHEIINAWARLYQKDHQKVLALGFMALDGLLTIFKDKERALEDTKTTGYEFDTKLGKGLAVESRSSYLEHLAQKQGYTLVIRRLPEKGNIRLVARWDKGVDLTPVYHKLKTMDPQASWFLHASKCMLLNGASSNPDMKPTKLSLDEVVKIVKQTFK